MRHKVHANVPCAVVRGLDAIRHAWAILIIYEALDCRARLDQFQKILGIALNMLTRQPSELTICIRSGHGATHTF